MTQGEAEADVEKTSGVDIPLNRTILGFVPEMWTRIIALMTMAHGALFFIGGTGILFVRLCGFSIHLSQIRMDAYSLYLFLLLGMALSSAGLLFGKHLLNGVDEKSPRKLLEWMLFTVFVQILPLLAFFIFLLYEPLLTISWIFSAIGVMIPVMLYCFCLVLVNIYRRQLLKFVAKRDGNTIAIEVVEM